MPSIYKYRFDRHTIYWTLVYLVVFILLGGLLYHLYEGGYLSAWFTSFIVALIALMSLSIPRRIVVSDEKVEIRCLLDITEIRRDEIASVRRVDARRMQWFVPIFGGCGFFGYYGLHRPAPGSTGCGSMPRSGAISSKSPTSTRTGSTSRAPTPTVSWPNSPPRAATAPTTRTTTKRKDGSQFALPLLTLIKNSKR